MTLEPMIRFVGTVILVKMLEGFETWSRIAVRGLEFSNNACDELNLLSGH